MASPDPVSSPRAAGALRLGLILVGAGLLANAAVHLYAQLRPSLDAPAFAQPLPAERLVGARGLYMTPAQLGPTTFGLYLMDVDAQSIAVYRAVPETNRLKLMAVRKFRQDPYLDDFNNESPTPKEVEKLLQAQRQREQLNQEPPTPKKDDPKTPQP